MVPRLLASTRLACCLVLLGMFLTGVGQRPAIGTIAGALIIIDNLLPVPILLPMGTNPEINLLPTCFAFGAILALNKDNVRLHHSNYLGLALLTWFFLGTKYAHCLLIMTACIGTLVLSGSSWVKRLKFRHDISYGIYLWGFRFNNVSRGATPIMYMRTKY